MNTTLFDLPSDTSDIVATDVDSAHSRHETIGGKFDDMETEPLAMVITALLEENINYTNIILHENMPVTLRLPKRLLMLSDWVVSKESLSAFFETIEPEWKERIKGRAFDKAKNLENFRLRANCFTHQGGSQLGAVIRKFPSKPFPLTKIGLHQNGQNFAKLDRGLVLVVGDTCKGKSTTLASLLGEINHTRAGHILTIEDPIETMITRENCVVTQREVGGKYASDVASYYDGAQDAMREQPNVVMIGEIRDAETAAQAIALAEAGILTFASLHARSPELALTKLMRLLGDDVTQAEALINCLRGVITQALVPSVDGMRFHLATECLNPSQEIFISIRSRQIGNIRKTIDTLGTVSDSGTHTMNSELLRLCVENSVTPTDAMDASLDRKQFAALLKQHGISA